MPQSYNVPQLVSHLQGLLSTDSSPVEHEMIFAAALALPAGEYALLDGEDEDLPVWVNALGQAEILRRNGYTMMSGDLIISRLATRYGVGLLISWAADLWVVPTALIGFMAAE